MKKLRGTMFDADDNEQSGKRSGGHTEIREGTFDALFRHDG